MNIDRRSFLALVVSAVPVIVAACGATPTPTALPRPTVPVLGPAGPTVPAGQGARFSVDRTSIDFGNVRFDNPVRATFKITNTGTAGLALKVPPSVRAEVGC
jgi:hypothetical protein